MNALTHPTRTENPTEGKTMNTSTIKEFTALFSHDWNVTVFDNWLLVQDTATRWWCEASEITEGLLADFRTNTSAPGVCAYTELCQSTVAVHDVDVPKALVDLARKVYDLDNDESVTYGW